MEDTVATIVPVKKPRKSRAKAAVQSANVESIPTRTLEQLENVEFKDMRMTELNAVAVTLAGQVQRVQEMLATLEQNLKIKTRQVDKMLATMAYIRQTMDHANTSILLQIGACIND